MTEEARIVDGSLGRTLKSNSWVFQQSFLKYIFLRKIIMQSLRMLSVIFRFNKKPGYKKLITVGFQNLENFCYSTLTAWDALVFIVCHNRRICFARQKAFGFLVLAIFLKNFKKKFISGSLICFQIHIVLVSEVTHPYKSWFIHLIFLHSEAAVGSLFCIKGVS